MATEVVSHSKIHKMVADGMFKAELDSFFAKELAEEGYSGVEVRVTPQRTEIIVQATRTQEVLGEKGRRIRELTALIQRRFNFKEGTVELYAEKVQNRGLCAQAQAESLRYKLIGGLAVRRACYGVLRFIMESGAQGCELIVSGKLRGQRAKSMKFLDGLMIHAGEPSQTYVTKAVRSVLLKQGVLGIQVRIMLPHDPEGKRGPKKPLPDKVNVVEPKPEESVKEPWSEVKDKPAPAAAQPHAAVGHMGAPGAPIAPPSGPAGSGSALPPPMMGGLDPGLPPLGAPSGPAPHEILGGPPPVGPASFPMPPISQPFQHPHSGITPPQPPRGPY
jgi:small subunit ribosomal protein S3e